MKMPHRSKAEIGGEITSLVMCCSIFAPCIFPLPWELHKIYVVPFTPPMERVRKTHRRWVSDLCPDLLPPLCTCYLVAHCQMCREVCP